MDDGAAWRQRGGRRMPRSARARDDDCVGPLEHRLDGARHDQRMGARRVIIRGHDELEYWRRERLGKLDERCRFRVGPAAVFGKDEWLRGARPKGGEFVELRVLE